ncbi:uncharacterized protein LOC143561047 [Bidens hawaiensis]|uniref:uncharacterized protein LOC143561047 n=1 Tax=Bidens hawaiensis TaxID=980011 RepID=UPI00404A09A4
MAGDNGKKTDGGASDHTSPYYIHASDYPRKLHVNDVLTDANYKDWSQEMLNFLLAKNKVGFNDGSIEKPEPDSPTYMAWIRCDAMLKGWLNTAMEKEIRTSVKYASMKGTSVSAYFTKLRSIWDEIQYVLSIPVCNCNGCKCGIGKKLGELKDKERLYEFLLGLDNEFGTIHTQILAMQPIPSLNTAYHLVFDDEQQRSISSQRRPTIDSTAFQAFVPKKKDQSSSQNKFSHKDGKHSFGEQVKHCDFCGKDGHNKDSCFKRIGYPEWWSGKGKQEKRKPSAACVEGETSKIPGLTNEQYQQFVKIFGDKVNTTKEETAPVANMAGNIGQGGKWVIDSGATEHIIYNDFFLKNKIKKHYEPPVVIPNGDSIAVEGRGEHVLPNGITIKVVFHFPEFKCNLLSVSKLSQELQCAVTFFPNFCVMRDLSSRTLIGVGDCK